MIWELIFKISFGLLIIIVHIIPALIAIYYLIKEKQWFLLIPMSVLFLVIPILGSLMSFAQIISEGEEFNLGDMPLIGKIIFFVPLNLLIISIIMMSI